MEMEDCVKGFIIGGLIGAVLGILYAPKSGKETREEIRRSSEELVGKAKAQFEELTGKMEELAYREKEMLVEKKEKVKKALDAGVEAYKQG
jgi:gas vesicle protein